MPDTIIQALTKLFTEMSLNDGDHTTIYNDLDSYYTKNVLPLLENANKNQKNPWAPIVAATKKQAISLIEKLAAKKTISELAEIIYFQRALLGKSPYHSGGSIKKPLTFFLKKPEKKRKTRKINLNDALNTENLTQEDLKHYCLPYSILFKAERISNTNFAKKDILEILTAVALEEPDKLPSICIENAALKNSLEQLNEDEILSIFSHQKLTQPVFKLIFEYLNALKNGKALSGQNLITLCSYQPSALNYFLEQNKDAIDSPLLEARLFSADQIALILTKTKGDAPQTTTQPKREQLQNYHYSTDEFYTAISALNAKYEFIKEIKGEDLVKILCRLESSPERNDENQRIFNAANDNITTLPDDIVAYFFENADALLVDKFYARFNFSASNNNQKITYKKLLIGKLAKIPTKENVNRIAKTASEQVFNDQDITEIANMVLKMPVQYEASSIEIIETLMLNKQDIALETISKICNLNPKISIALLNSKAFGSKLTIQAITEVITGLRKQEDIMVWLNQRFLDHINPSNSNTIPEALLKILSAHDNANNAEIFRFIYFTPKLAAYIDKKIIIKSLSNKLHQDDGKLKRELENKLILEKKTERVLDENDIFQIFQDAEKNQYSLPFFIIKQLIIHLSNIGFKLAEFKDKIPSSNHSNQPSREEIENAYFSLVFRAHVYRGITKSKSKLGFSSPYDDIAKISNDSESPLGFINLVISKINHPDLVPHFFKESNISNRLDIPTITKIFSTAERKNISLPEPVKKYFLEKLIADKNLPNFLHDFFTSKNSHSFTDTSNKSWTYPLIVDIYEKMYEKNLTLSNDLTPDLALELLTTVMPISNHMREKLFSKIASEEKFTFENAIAKINNKPKARAAILMAAFFYPNSVLFENLMAYLKNAPNEIANIFLHGINQPGFNLDNFDLLSLLENPEALRLLYKENCNPLRLAFFNVCQSSLNIESKVLLAKKLTDTLSQEEIINIFIYAEKENTKITFQPEIARLLVKKLNFKVLPHLIKEAEKTHTVEILKLALENIYQAQIEYQHRNENKFSLPAFLLSALYGVFYYLSVVGCLLHFILPSTKPSRVYDSLRQAFHPRQVEREFIERFTKKVWLGKIAKKNTSVEDSKITTEGLENCPDAQNNSNSSNSSVSHVTENDQRNNSLINPNTGEIKPFCDKKNTYTYLFSTKKARLDYKDSAVKMKIKTIKKDGGVVMPDKKTYLLNGEEKEFFLSEKQKEKIQTFTSASKTQSAQMYLLST